jgi:hypothetical protein
MKIRKTTTCHTCRARKLAVSLLTQALVGLANALYGVMENDPVALNVYSLPKNAQDMTTISYSDRQLCPTHTRRERPNLSDSVVASALTARKRSQLSRNK